MRGEELLIETNRSKNRALGTAITNYRSTELLEERKEEKGEGHLT